MFPDLDIPCTGLQHYLLAKMYWRKLLAERGIGGKGEKGEKGEGLAGGEGEGVEAGVQEKDELRIGDESLRAGGKEVVEEEGGGEGEKGGGGGDRVEGEKGGGGGDRVEGEKGGGEGDRVEGKKEELKLEDLDPTLERCREAMAISEDYGSRAYYFVNGALLSLVRCIQPI